MPPLFDDYSTFDDQMTGRGEPPEPKPEPKNVKNIAANTIFDYIELFALTVFFVLIATLFLFRHAVVVGPSMEETLFDGDHLIISDAFYTPAYGDIVVFESFEETGINEPIIKRVIATAGQTVTITKNGVAVDGVPLDESSYAHHGGNLTIGDYLTYQKQHYTIGIPNADGTAYTYTVGENEVFVLGDNRFNSTDSRMFGPISIDCILGRVLFRISPISEFGGVD